MDRRGVAFISGKSQHGGTKASRSKCSKMDSPVDELSKHKFRAHFHIPDSIYIQLSNEEALSTDELPHNMIYFMKEQFVVGLCLPIPYLLKQFLHFFFEISPTFIHPNII